MVRRSIGHSSQARASRRLLTGGRRTRRFNDFFQQTTPFLFALALHRTALGPTHTVHTMLGRCGNHGAHIPLAPLLLLLLLSPGTVAPPSNGPIVRCRGPPYREAWPKRKRYDTEGSGSLECDDSAALCGRGDGCGGALHVPKGGSGGAGLRQERAAAQAR
jgi:hypothetical protein